jgi:multidrug efflux pump subunit AcrA (membrane-fusion protein)
LADCQSAITGVLTSQQATAAAQQQLQTLATDLNTAVAALTTALQSGTSGGPSGGSTAPSQPSAPAPAAPAAAPTAPSAPASGSGGSGGGSTPATAETIVADEAAITAANAQLTIAQNDQTLGNLTSPIAGTVAAIAITPGANVSAGSTTQYITVIGDGGYVVNSTATVTNVSKLKVQQPVAISVVGSSKQLAGTVSSIGLMNVSTSTSPSYNVTVAVSDKTATLLNGTSAKMTVTASTASSVLMVPTSALHRTGTTYSVDVLKNGQSVPVTVKIGASGTETTEISSGLSKGDIVILADIASTVGITSTTTSTSTGLSGLGGSTSTTTGRGGFGGGAGGRPGGGAAPGGAG